MKNLVIPSCGGKLPVHPYCKSFNCETPFLVTQNTSLLVTKYVCFSPHQAILQHWVGEGSFNWTHSILTLWGEASDSTSKEVSLTRVFCHPIRLHSGSQTDGSQRPSAQWPRGSSHHSNFVLVLKIWYVKTEHPP